MQAMEIIKLGFEVVFVPSTLILIFFGTVIGVIFGALPGVSSTMAVVLGLTFTYGLDPVTSIAFLVAVYCAAITGGGLHQFCLKYREPLLMHLRPLTDTLWQREVSP